jgi:hypothetical protein
MLNVRLEGDPGEAHAFLDALRGVGVEVAAGPTKPRSGGYSHVYATIRMPDGPTSGPVRVVADTGRALEPRRRGRR